MSLDRRAALMFDCFAGTTSATELAALHLTLGLHEHPAVQAAPTVGASAWVRFCTDSEIARLRASMQSGAVRLESLLTTPEGKPLPATLVRMLGDDLHALPDPVDRTFARSVAFASNTETDIDRNARARGARHDLLLAGSEWQCELLRSAGLTNVSTFAPGFDGRRFHPGPKKNLFPGRFVVFSGGRLDFRKGQDLVVAAVRAFRESHPETLLIHAWQHLWPEHMTPFSSDRHVSGLPRYVGGQLLTAPWLAANGLPADSVVDVGLVSNTVLPDIVREAHVGLFASRAEAQPSTAMLECMASGVPCIVSRNTGHTELAHEAIGYPLHAQSTVSATDARVRATDGWGAASVDEIVAQLELAFSNSTDARRRGVAAAREASQFAWHKHTARFVETIQPLLNAATSRAAA